MATSSTKSAPTESPAARWSKSGESRYPPRPPRGRPGRPRTDGRNGKASQNPREDQTPKPSNPPTSAEAEKLPKPALSVIAPSNPPSATKPKNSSRRPSRANSTIIPSRTSPVIDSPVSPTSSRSSNRRRRSGAGKGNNIPKITPPPPQDNLLRPGRPRIGTVPHTAPVKDTPPHLAPKPPRTPNGFDMSKDIDALVERVRAVAMAENRPSTPGSHIDWAGDEDDSLPDLDDWGITSLSTPNPKTQVISPIIVGGLKPLPEPSSSSNESTEKPQDDPSTSDDAQSHSPPSAEDPQVTPASQPIEGKTIQQTKPSEDKSTAPTSDSQKSEAFGDSDSPGSGGLAQSIHAPTAATQQVAEKEGLAGSTHAPRAIIDSSSAPAQLDAPRNRQIHARTQTVGRPFPRPSQNDSRPSRNGRGGYHSSRQHSRNHSSPATTTTSRPWHARPVLTGDAISRLAKVVGSTTTPPAKPTPVAD